MHLELVVPALFPAQDLPPVSMPALETLLARGRRASGPPASMESWLCRHFGAGDATAKEPSIPAGALTAHAHGLDMGSDAWLRADPVHLRADRDRVLLVPGQAISVTPSEAQALAAAMMPLLAGKFVLHAAAPGEWCMHIQGDAPAGFGVSAPIDLAGADIDAHLPPKQWHALLTELQMSLYDHPVNTAREQRGEPVINSVWFWGAGKLPRSASGQWHSVSGSGTVAAGLARLAGIRYRPPGGSAAEWLGRAPEDGRHLVILDDLRGASALGGAGEFVRLLAELESAWFGPLLAELKSGRIGMLTVHLPESGASFETVRGDLRRFWRRSRPLSEYRKLQA